MNTEEKIADITDIANQLVSLNGRIYRDHPLFWNETVGIASGPTEEIAKQRAEALVERASSDYRRGDLLLSAKEKLSPEERETVGFGDTTFMGRALG